MSTTRDLPQPLLEYAMRLSHERTKTATIIAALEDFVRKQKIRGLKRFRGRVDLDIDLSRPCDRK